MPGRELQPQRMIRRASDTGSNHEHGREQVPNTKELLEKLALGWSGDCASLISVYHPDCEFKDKAFEITHHGHKGIREVHSFTYVMMPDFKVQYGASTITSDAGAAQWIFTGTFSGEFEGKTFASRPVRIEGVSFMTFRDGLIATNTDYWNLDALRKQLSA